MRIRKSAAHLTSAEIAKFLEAVMILKNTDAPGHANFSRYDQFTAIHGAVMGVLIPDGTGTAINFGHGNIGFLPWHRQYLREFEMALSDGLGEEVSIPYWDWANHLGAATKVFTSGFMGPRRWGTREVLTEGVFRYGVPTSQRPSWWPSGLPGFRIDSHLAEGIGRALERGSMEPAWPPTKARIDTLVGLDLQTGNRHPYWYFWMVLEQGTQQFPQTHNAGHRFIGGHMGGIFSPSDPIFWLHHGNVDRIWHLWQKNRVDSGLSDDYEATYPDPGETSPFDGSIAPAGHKLGDKMWPWVAGDPNYVSASVSDEVRDRLPRPGHEVRVREVLDCEAIGISYQAPP